jgi:hypothetical protein
MGKDQDTTDGDECSERGSTLGDRRGGRLLLNTAYHCLAP